MRRLAASRAPRWASSQRAARRAQASSASCASNQVTLRRLAREVVGRRLVESRRLSERLVGPQAGDGLGERLIVRDLFGQCCRQHTQRMGGRVERLREPPAHANARLSLKRIDDVAERADRLGRAGVRR